MPLDKFIDSVITGKQLNEALGFVPLLKFMNDDDIHYGLQYKDGINHDILPFSSSGTCSPGGIYITTIEYWFIHINQPGDSGREVKIYDNAYVYVESINKLKCSQVWLGKREEKNQLVKRLFNQMIENNQKNAQEIIFKNLCLCIYTIRYIDDRYIEVITLIRIVKINGLFLEMIDPIYHTNELLLEAVKQNGLALKLVDPVNRTPEILLQAVKQNGLALRFIDSKNWTYRLLVEALKQTGHALQYINQEYRTRDILRHALKHPYALQYLGTWTPPDNNER